MKVVLLCLQALIFLTSNAQYESNNWCFGTNANISFENGMVNNHKPNKMYTEEACAAVSDAEGKLLFYSDGMAVWNRFNDTIQNGDSLRGNSASSGSALAVKHPGKPKQYFLFTIDTTGGVGFHSSLIDMENDSGKVLTEFKNTFIRNGLSEKITLARHANGKDYWILVHGWQSDELYAYLLDKNGLNKQPVVSKSAISLSGNPLNSKGCMKVSYDRKHLALALPESGQIELFDFDAYTGTALRPRLLELPRKPRVYGLEFSPGGSCLYVSTINDGSIFQLLLTPDDAESIRKSATKIGMSEEENPIGALQLACDGRIYVAQYAKNRIGVIAFPDNPGEDCAFVDGIVFLKPNYCALGLPQFAYDSLVSTQKRFGEEFVYLDPVRILKNPEEMTGIPFKLKDAYYDEGKSDIKPGFEPELKKLINILQTNQQLKLTLMGHTDNLGGMKENIDLSKSRADAIRDYLVKNGIDPERIRTQGFGSMQSVGDNATEEGRAKNRRVVVMLDFEF